MQLKVYRYCLRLERPLRLRNLTVTYREGVLLSPLDRPNCWGEAAPLPGFSKETVDDVIRSIQAAAAFQPPSLQFAMDSLRPVHITGRVPVSALLHGTAEEILGRADQLRDQPFTTVKLKVGWQQTLAQEVQLVAAVRQRLRNDQSLRLDANRRWPLTQAVRFAKEISTFGIEYIEEPVQRSRDCEAFFQKSGLPYALDETLVESPVLQQFPHAAAFVVKPTLLGNSQTLERLRAAEIPLVFSSCFETGLGLLNIARLATLYSPSMPAGIDTSRWLARDVLQPPLDTDQGFIDLDANVNVDYSVLEEVFG